MELRSFICILRTFPINLNRPINMMKKLAFLFTFCFLAQTAFAQSSPVGQWRTVDDKDGRTKSIVRIYDRNGKIYGDVVRLVDPTAQKNCSANCPAGKANKPIEGMNILWNLTRSGNEWSGGQIMDPKDGKVYSAKLWLEGANTLKVRGFFGISLLGRNQTWYRQQ
jgi:uncharacterized protein (DUF2147 family)